MAILSQPLPIILHIFKYTKYRTHFTLRLVCKKIKLLIDSEEISGSIPRNFFEFIIDNNIYYLKNYLTKIDESDLVCTKIINIKFDRA